MIVADFRFHEKNNLSSLFLSFRWFIYSAMQGNCAAQINVSRALEKGEGITKDINLAKQWDIITHRKSFSDNSLDFAIRRINDGSLTESELLYYIRIILIFKDRFYHADFFSYLDILKREVKDEKALRIIEKEIEKETNSNK